jgi:DNA mismatch endonuclease (patch repair protein)
MSGTYPRTPAHNKKMSELLKNNVKCLGNKNAIGYKHTEDWKRKMSKFHTENPNRYWLGKKFSKEHIQKLSSHPGNFLGRHHTEEAKKKNSIAHIKLFKEHPEKKIQMQKNRQAQIFPLTDTLPERLVQDALTKQGIFFEKHKSVLGQPDIFISPNICIFVDGCYWHSCEQCFDKNNFNAYQRAKIIKDHFITQKLIEGGYIVLRFWEHEIKKDINYVVYKIQNEIIMTTYSR